MPCIIVHGGCVKLKLKSKPAAFSISMPLSIVMDIYNMKKYNIAFLQHLAGPVKVRIFCSADA